jgi:hypothetical protein
LSYLLPALPCRTQPRHAYNYPPFDSALVDTQQVELVGRAVLESALIRAGFEVAHPNRDLGIDLIVYTADPGAQFGAVPLQLKVTTESRFSLDRKYERFEGLVMAYVWLEDDPRIFLMKYEEALTVLGEKATATTSWRERGYYTDPKVSQERRAALAEFEDRWDWLRETLASSPSLASRAIG